MKNLINLLENNVQVLFTVLVLVLMSNLIVLMIVGTVTTFVIAYLVTTSLLVFATVLFSAIVYTFKK